MIIDLILDRKDGCSFDPVEFANEIQDYSDVFPEICAPILQALESKTEQRVKHALCGYVLEQEYNPEICDYINAVSWLPAWWDME